MQSRRIWALVAVEVMSAVFLAVNLVLGIAGVIPYRFASPWWVLGAFILFCLLICSHMYHLYSRLTPRLDIQFGNTSTFVYKYPFRRKLPLDEPGGTYMTFRILVKNLSEAQTIRNVSVRLLDTNPSLGFVPIPLHLMHDNTPPYKTAFDLDPGPGEYVDVFSCVDDPNSTTLQFSVTPDNVWSQVLKKSYELTILALGENVPDCKRSFVINVDTKGAVSFSPSGRK